MDILLYRMEGTGVPGVPPFIAGGTGETPVPAQVLHGLPMVPAGRVLADRLVLSSMGGHKCNGLVDHCPGLLHKLGGGYGSCIDPGSIWDP